MATRRPEATTYAGGSWWASTERRVGWWCTTRSALPPSSRRCPVTPRTSRPWLSRRRRPGRCRRCRRPERMGGEEGDLDHVVPAEGVVGVLDVVLSERDGYPIAVSSRTGRCSGPVCGSLTKPRPARLARPARRSSEGRGVQPDGAGVVGDTAADQSVLEHRVASISVVRRPGSPVSSTSIATRRPCGGGSAHIRWTCSRASASVCSIHGMPPTTSAPSSIASRTRVSAPGSRSRPSCGNATTCRSTTPRNSSRSASSGMTPSSCAEVSTSANASTCRTPYRTASSTAHRALGSIQERSYSALTAEASSIACIAEAMAPGVRRERGVAGPVERVHLVQVQVTVHVALGDQPAGGIDLDAAGQRLLGSRSRCDRRRCRSATARGDRAATRPPPRAGACSPASYSGRRTQRPTRCPCRTGRA